MTRFEFQIEEVRREGFIAWDAVEVTSRTRFPVNADQPYLAGRFPEISTYLRDRNIEVEVAYMEWLDDSFNGTTWRYTRGDVVVIVHDIPRTIVEISFFTRR